MNNRIALRVRFGCPLSIVLTAATIAAVEVARARLLEREISFDRWSLFTAAVVAAPFAVLAIARTRDWLAWVLAIAATLGSWAWLLRDLTFHHGVNFGLGIMQQFVAPLLISVLALATAGVRGKIPDWGIDAD